MKHLYTSNYARNGSNPLAISISVGGGPRWYRGLPTLPELAPTWDMVKEYKKTGSIPDYLVEFEKILDKLDPIEIVARIPENSILLCYESPKDFCHRHLVAEWLNISGEAQVSELLKPIAQRVIWQVIEIHEIMVISLQSLAGRIRIRILQARMQIGSTFTALECGMKGSHVQTEM